MSDSRGTGGSQATEVAYGGDYCFYQGHYYAPGTERCMIDQGSGESRIFICVAGSWEPTGEPCEITFDEGSAGEAS